MSAIQVSPWWHWAPVLHVTPSTVRVSPLRYIYIYICFACWVAEGKHFKSCFTLCRPIFSGIPRQHVQLQPGTTDGGWLLNTKGNVIRLASTTNHQSLFYWYFNTWNPLQYPNDIKNYIIPFQRITWKFVSFYIPLPGHKPQDLSPAAPVPWADPSRPWLLWQRRRRSPGVRNSLGN